MVSELEQGVGAETEGLSGATWESLIKSASGGEKCFEKREGKLQSCRENQMGVA